MPRGPLLTTERLRQTIRDVDRYGGVKAASEALGVKCSTLAARYAKALAVLKLKPSPKKRGRPKAGGNKQLEKWKQYVQGGRVDDELLKEILTAEMAWVVTFAKNKLMKIPGGIIKLQDLVAQGYFAILQSAKRYDPELGNTFCTFAGRRVNGAFSDFLRDEDPVSRINRQRFNLQQKRRSALESRLGRSVSQEEVDQELPPDCRRHINTSPVSIEAVVHATKSADREISVQGMIESKEDDPGQHVRLEDTFKRMFKHCSMDDQAILWLYYIRGCTMKKIAAAFDLSESRISQLTSNAREQLLKRPEAMRILEEEFD